MDPRHRFLVRPHKISPTPDVISFDTYPVSHMKVCCGCRHMCVYVCACLEARAGCRQWPLGNQGALCHASINVWHCVSWDDAWLVYEASKNDGWVMASRGYSVCVSCVMSAVCVCVLAGVRDTGQHCDMSGWHPVKASWQRVVTLPSGSHTPLQSHFSRFTSFSPI